MTGAFLTALWMNAAEAEQGMIAAKQETNALRRTQLAAEMPLCAGAVAEIGAGRLTELAVMYENMATEEVAEVKKEERVYSFLQGPKSWGERRAWSGEWSGKYVNGNYFGNFGCGLCCMANLYSSLTEHECSPWEMYGYARQVSGYSPTKKVGAIGWADMKVTLRKSGFDCSLNRKPETYEEFQKQIAEAKGTVVLVCSRDDDTYWKKTGGHYVNIWFYDEETDEVFLTDPGVPEHNRQWVPLQYIYDALKTVSQYQYLLVKDYEEENNLWKYDGIADDWAQP